MLFGFFNSTSAYHHTSEPLVGHGVDSVTISEGILAAVCQRGGWYWEISEFRITSPGTAAGILVWPRPMVVKLSRRPTAAVAWASKSAAELANYLPFRRRCCVSSPGTSFRDPYTPRRWCYYANNSEIISRSPFARSEN